MYLDLLLSFAILIIWVILTPFFSLNTHKCLGFHLPIRGKMLWENCRWVFFDLTLKKYCSSELYQRRQHSDPRILRSSRVRERLSWSDILGHGWIRNCDVWLLYHFAEIFTLFSGLACKDKNRKGIAIKKFLTPFDSPKKVNKSVFLTKFPFTFL